MLKTTLLTFLFASFLLHELPAQTNSLNFYLEKGLKNSPLLRDYSSQVSSVRIDSLLVLCGYKPQVELSSQALIAPVSTHFGYDEAITNGGNYAAVVGVKQSLINKKIKSAQLQSIELLKQSLDVNRLISETDLKENITSQYITAFADFSLVQYYRQVIGKLSSQKDAVKSLVESGIYLQTDLMNLALVIKAQEITLKQTFIQYKNDLAILNLYCGMVDTSYVELTKPVISEAAVMDFNSLPAIRQSKADSLKNTNSRTLLDLNYRPRLETFADAGFMAVKPLNIPNNFGTSFGLNLSMPIYDGKQRYYEYRKIDLAENTRMLYRDAYIVQYSQQQRQLQEQLRLTNGLILDITQQLDQQKEIIDIYKIEIEKGIVRFTDFLLAINNYTDIQNNLAMAEMNRMQLINQLTYLK